MNDVLTVGVVGTPTTLLTPDEVAERWRCSVGWLGNMRSRGEGPQYIKLGSKVLYDLRAVEDFEDRGRVTPVAP